MNSGSSVVKYRHRAIVLFERMRPINCGFRCLKGSLFFLEVVSSIVNPVNKLYSRAYEVQQTFFVPAEKKNMNK